MSRALHPPGPPPLPVLGNLLAFRRDPLAFFTRCSREYGDVVHYQIGAVNAYLLSRPDLIEQVLVRDSASFSKGRVVRSNHLLLGNGLLASEGQTWLRLRRLSQPAFHREHIVAWAETIGAAASRMLDGWQDGQIRDVHQDMTRLALQIIASILLGDDLQAETEMAGAAIRAVWEEFAGRLRTGLLIPETWPTPGNRRYQGAVRRLDALVLQLIQRRRDAQRGSASEDYLSILLAAQEADGSRLSDSQVRDEVMNMFVAGHETTALLLTWALYLLAQHAQAHEQLCAELDQVLQARPPQIDDLGRLPYLQQVIKEVLRLYPPVWALPRLARQSVVIGGYEVPAGASVTLSQWVVQRDPRYFADPLAFNPGRWEADLEKRLPAFAYFPFGAGPRQCIGYPLAQTEAALLLAAITQRYCFTLVPGQPVKPWPSITLYPRYGVKVRVSAPAAGGRLDAPHKTRPAHTYQIVTPTAPKMFTMANNNGTLNTNPKGMSICSRPTRMPNTESQRSKPPPGAQRPARLAKSIHNPTTP
jgi:cytochrome P450